MVKNIILITNDNCQFSGNKENKVDGFIYIENFKEAINQIKLVKCTQKIIDLIPE